jgi:hypothetical protein
MKHPPRVLRTPLKLRDSVHQQVNMYALAATAAGVGMLALAPPAEAKIVYTRVNVTLPMNQYYALDLNHDGKTDFAFYGGTVCKGSRSSVCSAYLFVTPNAVENEIWGQQSYASALRAGVKLGPGGRFSPRAVVMAGDRTGGSPGQWGNGGKGVTNRYLGLKFQIKGKTHFGWARLSVAVNRSRPFLVAKLTGYAYETVADKPIITGKTKGLDEANSAYQPSPASLKTPARKPATLGMLAMGWRGLPIWHHEDSADAAQ